MRYIYINVNDSKWLAPKNVGWPIFEPWSTMVVSERAVRPSSVLAIHQLKPSWMWILKMNTSSPRDILLTSTLQPDSEMKIHHNLQDRAGSKPGPNATTVINWTCSVFSRFYTPHSWTCILLVCLQMLEQQKTKRHRLSPLSELLRCALRGRLYLQTHIWT